MTTSISEIRKDFPLLMSNDVIYLDTAATSQKPSCVLEAERTFYEKYNANPLRGLYELGEAATEKYEEARETVREFLNAREAAEIVFVRNATEGLNLVAYSFGSLVLKPGDEILVSIMEHHSNLLPWQQAAARTGAVVKYLECTEDGKYTEEAFKEALSERTKIVAMTQVSNVLGCKNDIKRFAQLAHEAGAYFVADGAQSVPHMAVDVQDLDVDFLAFSGHKMYAPMGIGALYAKRELLEQMPPFLCGGEMIDSVSRTGAVWAEVPHKFEAGTVNGAGAYALAEAIRYVQKIGFDFIEEREAKLTAMLMDGMKEIPAVHILGSQKAEDHHGIVTFKLDGVHPHDVASILDADHIAVRAGHHCAQPLLQHLKVLSTTRVSLGVYNTEEEIQASRCCQKTVHVLSHAGWDACKIRIPGLGSLIFCCCYFFRQAYLYPSCRRYFYLFQLRLVHAKPVPGLRRQSVNGHIIFFFHTDLHSSCHINRCCPSSPDGSDCSSPPRIPTAAPSIHCLRIR